MPAANPNKSGVRFKSEFIRNAANPRFARSMYAIRYIMMIIGTRRFLALRTAPSMSVSGVSMVVELVVARIGATFQISSGGIARLGPDIHPAVHVDGCAGDKRLFLGRIPLN